MIGFKYICMRTFVIQANWYDMKFREQSMQYKLRGFMPNLTQYLLEFQEENFNFSLIIILGKRYVIFTI